MNVALADPRQAPGFAFTSCGYDSATGEAYLAYRFTGGPELVERIRFPDAPAQLDTLRQAAFDRALKLLHAIAGVSYYKAGLSPRLHLPPSYVGLDEFLTELYVQGLAEFGYVNKLDVRARVRFTPSEGSVAEQESGEAPSALDLPERALVAMGGGKDSLVGMDLLVEAGLDVLPFCVGGSALIEDTVRAAGMPLRRIDRKLAPELAEMNRAGAWNGHVPVTAINSAIGVCAAILYGFRYVVFSNERSADEATLYAADGQVVNHQFSKSSLFEHSFRKVLSRWVDRGVQYFSILRPFAELAVVERFSHLKQFHPVFSSCNRNFHLDGPRIAGRWCRDCPKCRFAALSLAAFLPPDGVTAILGGDLLDDPAQEEGFRALCRLGRDKPFECVGEAGECRAALAAVASDERWAGHAVVRALAPELDGLEVAPLEQFLQLSGSHSIPSSIARRAGLPEAGAHDIRRV